jgi:hypothetical protein
VVHQTIINTQVLEYPEDEYNSSADRLSKTMIRLGLEHMDGLLIR